MFLLILKNLVHPAMAPRLPNQSSVLYNTRLFYDDLARLRGEMKCRTQL